MTIDVSEDILSHLAKNGLMGEVVHPDYSGFSIMNAAPTIAAFLGINLNAGKPLQELGIVRRALEEEGISPVVEKVVLLFIDSFNKKMEDQILKRVDERCVRGLLTSVFPSLTPTCTASMTTGMPPISHGIIGFNVPIAGSIYSIFELEPKLGGRQLPIDIVQRIFDLPDIFALCEKRGIECAVLLPAAIASKASSTAVFNRIRIESYTSFGDMFSKIESCKERFLYVYTDVFDTILHDRGAASPEIQSTLSDLAEGFKSQIDNLENMLIFFIADHGQTQLNPDNSLWLDDERLLECYTHPPAVNGGRIAYLYTDNVEKTASILEEARSRTILLEPEDALSEGLFGEGSISPRFKDWVGDLILVAKGDTYLRYPYLNDRCMKSSHGGLSHEEMLVPFSLIEL